MVTSEPPAAALPYAGGFPRCLSEPDGAEFRRYPPVIPRRDLEQSEFLKSFPHLAGSVYSLEGDGRAHATRLEHIDNGAPYAEFQEMTDVALAPAACYPIYPSSTGTLPAAGRLFDVLA